jgi:haloalkane dehalogenase
MLDIRDDTFDGTFPFAPRYLSVNGFRMHFVDEGEGDPILFVHGDPTWSYLWRRFILALSGRHRCVVPDQMGMGKSEVPQDAGRYRLVHHVANLESLLLRLDLRDLTLVLHDWGGPVGLGVAIRHRERIRRLVLMNTWAFAPWPAGPLPRLLEIIRSSRGEHFVLKKNGYVEAALRAGSAHPETLTPAGLAAYLAPFPTPASRLALLCWSRDIPVAENDPSFAEMQRIERALPTVADLPTLIVWGMRDTVLPEAVLRLWQRVLPGAQVRELADAGHFLQEDAPAPALRAVEEFLAALDRSPRSP